METAKREMEVKWSAPNWLRRHWFVHFCPWKTAEEKIFLELKWTKLSSGSFVFWFVSTSQRSSCKRQDAAVLARKWSSEILRRGVRGGLVVRLTGKDGGILGWGPQNLEQICRVATMGWAENRGEGGSRHRRPTISQHKQPGASGLLGPLSPLLRCLFLFGQLRHNAGVGPAATGRGSDVCRKDVTRLQERRATKWRPIVLSAQRDTGSDSQEDGIISAADKSLTGPKVAAVCERARLSSAAYFTYHAARRAAKSPSSQGQKCGRTLWGLMSKSRQIGLRCDLNYSQSPARGPTKGAEHAIRTTHR